MRIRKAVFPVAGLGTRFLPATKASPKEMLTVVDKPLIQYAVEEAISAGAEELVFVTGRTKNAIMDHFDKAYELETELELRNKHKMLDVVRSIVPKGVTCTYIRQAEAMGLGHAVLCAESVVNDQDFCVILADDLIDGQGMSCMAQMREVYQQYGCSVIAVQRVPRSEVSSYGVVEVKPIGPRVGEIKRIVEKPKPEEAPSDLAVVGRYILTPRIMQLLHQIGKGAGGEIQLTDAIARLLTEQTVIAYEFEGVRHDCGSKLGYLRANVELGLTHPELGKDFASYLRGRATDLASGKSG